MSDRWAQPDTAPEVTTRDISSRMAHLAAADGADGAETLTPDPADFSIKHPLQEQWTMLYDVPYPGSPKGWGENVKTLMEFGAVEDFWCMYK
jgi:translation initiation factor 4E